MFDYHSCGKHLGLVWYADAMCPDCQLEATVAVAKAFQDGVREGEHREYCRINKLNPGKPLTEHQIDRLE